MKLHKIILMWKKWMSMKEKCSYIFNENSISSMSIHTCTMTHYLQVSLYNQWECLRLNTHPYKISWVRKRIDILLSEMLNVMFNVGWNLFCKVLGDVLDMEVCHLILGGALTIWHQSSLWWTSEHILIVIERVETKTTTHNKQIRRSKKKVAELKSIFYS